jgi:hypothetical protein
MNSFLATRPLTSSDLVLAKLKLAARSALAAWVVMLLFVAVWLLAPARDGERTGPLGTLLFAYLPPKGELTLCLLLAGLAALTWKFQVEGLFLDYTGRRWIIYGANLAAACLITAGLWFLAWLGAHPHLIPQVLDLLPRLASYALVLKGGTGAWALQTLLRQRVLSSKALVILMAGWLLFALALFVLLHWLLPTNFVAPRHLALGILLTLPLTRLALAPLALKWNRHR